MSEVYIGSAGARWIAQMVARIRTVAEAVADGGNSGDDALTAGGAYGGTVDQIYTVEITKAGGAGVAEITVTGSNGDNSGPTIVTGEEAWLPCGNLGTKVYLSFGLDGTIAEGAVGDKWTIPCTGVDEIKYCALGSGDETFTDPENPPGETEGEGLLGEFARVHYCTWDDALNIPGKAYLVEDPNGRIAVDGVNYSIAPGPTNIVLYTFVFGPDMGVGTVKEWGLFADNAKLLVEGQYAEGGLFDPDTNPGGEVDTLGTRVCVKNIHDWEKAAQDTLIVRQLLIG